MVDRHASIEELLGVVAQNARVQEQLNSTNLSFLDGQNVDEHGGATHVRGEQEAIENGIG